MSFFMYQSCDLFPLGSKAGTINSNYSAPCKAHTSIFLQRTFHNGYPSGRKVSAYCRSAIIHRRFTSL